MERLVRYIDILYAMVKENTRLQAHCPIIVFRSG